MTVFILCLECGEDIGEIYSAYMMLIRKFCKKMIKENKYHIDVDMIDFKPELLSNTEFILNSLNITNMCCRTHVITASDFDIEL